MNILKIMVNKQLISLPDDFVIRMQLLMPYPFLENVPAAITYWFDFQSNPVNDVIFKHANYIYSTSGAKIYNCVLEVALYQMKGLLYLKNADKKTYKAFIVFNDLIESLAAKKIAAVVDYSYYMGDDTDTITAEMERLQALNFPEANYAFPSILNSIFFDDAEGDNALYSGRLNRWDFTDGYYNKNYYYAADDVPYNVTAMVPQPYLLHIIKEIFRPSGFSLVGDVLTNVNFQKLLVYSNYAEQNFVKTDYVKVSLASVSFSVDGEKNYLVIGSVEEDSDGCWSGSSTYQSLNDGTFLARFVAEGIYTGSNSAGATFSVYVEAGGAVVGQVVTTVLTSGDTSYIEGYCEIVSNNPTYTFFMTSQNSDYSGSVTITGIEMEVYPKINQNVDEFTDIFLLKNHVPDLTVTDFIDAITKKFCLGIFFDFDEKVVELASWKKILTAGVAVDLTSVFIKDSEKFTFEQITYSLKTTWENDDLAENSLKLDFTEELTESAEVLQTYPVPTTKGKFLLIVPANLVYISGLNDSGIMDWSFYSDYFQDLENVSTENEDLPTIGTLFFRQADTASKTYYPAIEQAAGSELLGKNDPGLKVYNNHGFQEIGDYSIPFASNSNKDFAGEDIGGFNFNMAAADGLYNEQHKDFYDYLKSRDLVEMEFDINADIFHKLIKLFVANQAKRKVRVGSRNYIPEKVDISIGMKNFKACKISLR